MLLRFIGKWTIAGHPKSIKRLKSGDLLLEVEKKSHITNLLKTKTLFDLQGKISLHGSLNTSKGVVRCQDLVPCTDDEILDNLRMMFPPFCFFSPVQVGEDITVQEQFIHNVSLSLPLTH